MFEESDLVYQTLRDTIIHCEDRIRTAEIYMYTVYFTLVGLGFSFNRHLLLLAFFVLIVFQSMVNSDRIAIVRVSSYIRVFFETPRNDMHWESINMDPNHQMVYSALHRDIGWRANVEGTAILSVATFFIVLYKMVDAYDYTMKNILGRDWIELMVALFLSGMAIYINTRRYIDKGSTNHKLETIDASINKFYVKCCNESPLKHMQTSKD